jgi:hypothetical protein
MVPSPMVVVMVPMMVPVSHSIEREPERSSARGIMPSDCFTCCDIDWLIAGDAISARVAAAINANFFIGLFLELNVICPWCDNAPGGTAVPCCAAIISEQCCARMREVDTGCGQPHRVGLRS